jgi:hypothetical protein
VFYQHGVYNHLLPGHGTPLATILVNWWGQVENADWGIDDGGVVGGEECWKKADMEDHAEDLRVEWAC